MADRFTETAFDYAEGVLHGNIPACKFVVQACQRFADDLQRPDLYYDSQAVSDCGEFFTWLPHVSGEWRGQRFEPSPYQCFIIANIIGLHYAEGEHKGFRKYKEAYVEVPRKSGKSTFAAGFCLYFLTMDGEPGAEVYCAATNEKQAYKVFHPAYQMLRDDDELRQHLSLDVLQKSIYNDSENLSFKPVVGDPPDGDSPSFVVIDEYHEHDHARAYETFKTGTGARRRAMLFVITTAGDNIDGPCHRLRGDMVDILAGTLTDTKADRQFAIIYTIKDDADPDHWKTDEALYEANPNIGHSTFIGTLREDQQEAIRSRHQQTAFKTKNLNIWIGQADPWIDMNAWAQNGYDMLPVHREYEDKEREEGWTDGDPDAEIVSPDDPRVFDMLKHLPCVVVTDLAAKIDFTAAVVLFYEDDKDVTPAVLADGTKKWPRIYWAVPFFWLPRATFEKVRRYEPWEPYITLHEGEEIDILKVAATITNWLNDLLAKEYITDPNRSSGVEQTVGESVVWTEIVRFGQGAATYTNAMYEFQSAVDSGRFRHPDNPVLNWMVDNFVGKRYDDDTVKPPRPKNRAKKIDGAICCTMGCGRAMNLEADEPVPKIETIPL